MSDALPLPGIDSPGRDALADELHRALDEDMRYDDDDWTRLADAALTWCRARVAAPPDVTDALDRIGAQALGTAGREFTDHIVDPAGLARAVGDFGLVVGYVYDLGRVRDE